MRHVLRLIWVGLVLLIVALVSALISMSLAIHGREVRVPDLRSKTPVEARQLADAAGLNWQIERQYYSSTVPAGKILSQTPLAGTVVRRGFEIRLAVSLGPQRVTIPAITGDSERAALISINQRGLDLGSTATVALNGAAAGQVIAQNPPPNATDASSPKINLLVAQDPAPEAYVTPSFIGQPLGTATNTLKDAGFSVGRVTMVPAAVATTPDANPVQGPQPNSAANQASPTPGGTAPPQQNPVSNSPPSSPTSAASPTPASIILSQDPAPGQKILAGAGVNFVVR